MLTLTSLDGGRRGLTGVECRCSFRESAPAQGVPASRSDGVMERWSDGACKGNREWAQMGANGRCFFNREKRENRETSSKVREL